MTTVLMLYATSIAAVLACAAAALERVCAWRRTARRWTWTLTLAASLALSAVAPWRTTTVAPPAATSMRTDAGASAAMAWSWTTVSRRLDATTGAFIARAIRFDAVARTLWLVATLALVGIAAGGRYALARRRRQWREVVVLDTTVLVAPDTGPALVGLWHPRIVLPGWALEAGARDLDLLLRHEREHARARDPWLTHLAGVALLLMPWNPAIWWLTSRLRLAIELDCDARVLDAARMPAHAAPIDARGVQRTPCLGRGAAAGAAVVPATRLAQTSIIALQENRRHVSH